jgi:hypothetical protein
VGLPLPHLSLEEHLQRWDGNKRRGGGRAVHGRLRVLVFQDPMGAGIDRGALIEDKS